MWSSLVENSESLRAIYGNESPSLKDIQFHEINIVNGADIQCNLRFDIKELPPRIPEAWMSRHVNAVQINLNLINVEIVNFEYSGGRLLGNLDIQLKGNSKQVSFTIFNRVVFVIKAKWLYVSAITGYSKE
jgi:hypothetical protein